MKRRAAKKQSRLESLVFNIGFLCRNETFVKQNVAAIADLGGDSIPMLCKLLRGRNSLTQLGAITAIWHLRPSPQAVMPALLHALSKGDVRVARAAAYTLASFGSSCLPPLREALRSKIRNARAAAMMALTEVADHWGKEVISGFAALVDPNRSLRVDTIPPLANKSIHARDEVVLHMLMGVYANQDSTSAFGECLQSFFETGLESICELLKSGDEQTRESAVTTLRSVVACRLALRRHLFALINDNSDEDMRMQALRSLELIGVDAANLLSDIMEALTQAKTGQFLREVMVRSTLAEEKILTQIEKFVGVRREHFRLATRRGGKRPIAELEKSVLALLDTCVEWGTESVSERKLHASALLKANRAKLGLDDDVSQTSVHNHLVLLAKFCEETNLFEVHNKRQESRFRGGVKKKLAAIRGIVEARIADDEQCTEKSC
jgi:HEAT repeat protein